MAAHRGDSGDQLATCLRWGHVEHLGVASRAGDRIRGLSAALFSQLCWYCLCMDNASRPWPVLDGGARETPSVQVGFALRGKEISQQRVCIDRRQLAATGSKTAWRSSTASWSWRQQRDLMPTLRLEADAPCMGCTLQRFGSLVAKLRDDTMAGQCATPTLAGSGYTGCRGAFAKRVLDGTSKRNRRRTPLSFRVVASTARTARRAWLWNNHLQADETAGQGSHGKTLLVVHQATCSSRAGAGSDSLFPHQSGGSGLAVTPTFTSSIAMRILGFSGCAPCVSVASVQQQFTARFDTATMSLGAGKASKLQIALSVSQAWFRTHRKIPQGGGDLGGRPPNASPRKLQAEVRHESHLHSVSHDSPPALFHLLFTSRCAVLGEREGVHHAAAHASADDIARRRLASALAAKGAVGVPAAKIAVDTAASPSHHALSTEVLIRLCSASLGASTAGELAPMTDPDAHAAPAPWQSLPSSQALIRDSVLLLKACRQNGSQGQINVGSRVSLQCDLATMQHWLGAACTTAPGPGCRRARLALQLAPPSLGSVKWPCRLVGAAFSQQAALACAGSAQEPTPVVCCSLETDAVLGVGNGLQCGLLLRRCARQLQTRCFSSPSQWAPTSIPSSSLQLLAISSRMASCRSP